MNKEFKTYKEFLNESKGFDQSKFPLEDPEEIKQWIKENLEGKINQFQKHLLSGDWEIDKQGYFSTTGNLRLDKMNLTKLPFRIKSIGGSFEFHGNQLTSLEGLENLASVGGNFSCNDNQLTSLEGLENLEFVGSGFECYFNALIDFKGLENLESVGDNFDCDYNQLTSLKDLENLEFVGGDFTCSKNKLLSKKIPFKVKGDIKFESSDNPYKYKDSIKYLISLSEREQKKIIEDLMEFDSQAYRKLTNYAIKNNIELPLDKEVYKWNKAANDLDDTGLEF
jgi:hypothetical protein